VVAGVAEAVAEAAAEAVAEGAAVAEVAAVAGGALAARTGRKKPTFARLNARTPIRSSGVPAIVR